MKLQNHTPYHAKLFRGVIEDRRLFGSVAARLAYDIVGDQLRVAEEQPWEVSPARWQSEFGPMPGDELLIRGGVDVFVNGFAQPLHGQPVTEMDVEVKVGESWSSSIRVFGERTWEGGLTGLRPSAPMPFAHMPLKLTHAFGGARDWDGLSVPFPDNPEGKGFYLNAKEAEGKPLPNIEDPELLIRRWDDRPEPVGVESRGFEFAPRVRRSLVIDEQQGALKELRSTFFNAAFPKMIAPWVQPGERVAVSGVRPEGELAFVLPDSGLRVHLRFGEWRAERELTIDQIGIDAVGMRAMISYRYPFRYELVPMQEREVRLAMKES